MISSFFGKPKPINSVIAASVLLLVFVFAKISVIDEPFTLYLFLKQAGIFALCLLTVFLLDFLVSKNNLTRKNSYKILMFVLFVALLPKSLLNTNYIIANIFVLFALRRLISLRSQKTIKKKLFDAAFWVTLATLFCPWCVLFFILVIISLFLYSIVDIKNWVIPILAVVTVVVIGWSFMIVAGIDYTNYIQGMFATSFDFSNLNDIRIVVAITLLLSYGNWAIIFYIRQLKSKKKNYRPSFIIILFAELIALAIAIIIPNKNGSEFLFLFAPLAIIVTNYIEIVEERWFREVLLFLLILAPIINLIL